MLRLHSPRPFKLNRIKARRVYFSKVDLPDFPNRIRFTMTSAAFRLLVHASQSRNLLPAAPGGWMAEELTELTEAQEPVMVIVPFRVSTPSEEVRFGSTRGGITIPVGDAPMTIFIKGQSVPAACTTCATATGLTAYTECEFYTQDRGLTCVNENRLPKEFYSEFYLSQKGELLYKVLREDAPTPQMDAPEAETALVRNLGTVGGPIIAAAIETFVTEGADTNADPSDA